MNSVTMSHPAHTSWDAEVWTDFCKVCRAHWNCWVAGLFAALLNNSKLFSKMVVPIYTPIRSELPLYLVLPDIFILAKLVGV